MGVRGIEPVRVISAEDLGALGTFPRFEVQLLKPKLALRVTTA
jgi:hypothetical protein